MKFPANVILERCPFCNGKDALYIDVFYADFSYTEYWVRVLCSKCRVQKDIYGTYSTEEEAILAAQKEWNDCLTK